MIDEKGDNLERLYDPDSYIDDFDIEEVDKVEPPCYLEPFCVFLGAAALLGLTCCINAIDLFETMFPDSTDISAMVSRIINFCSFGMMLLIFPIVEKVTAVTRFTVAQAIVSMCFIFYMFYTNLGKDPKLYAIYIVFVITGLNFGIMMGTINGFCGILGKNGGSLSSIGNAAAGIFSTILRLVSKPMGKIDGWFYFGSAFALCILSLILFILFQKTPYCIQCKKYAKKGDDTLTRLKRVGVVIKKCYREFLESLFCHIVTYSIFPGYATSTQIKHNLGRDWVTTIITSIYMVFDFLGRFSARFWKWPPPKYLWIPVVVRLVFYPLFMISIEGVAIVDEIYIMVLSALLPFTGGYFITCAMGYTAINPKLEKDELEIATYTVGFGTSFGCTLGCLLSFAMPVR